MRKIIKGQSYNTKRARLIGEHDNGHHNWGKPAWCHETLYRSLEGAYFLYGEGGAESRYACVANGETVAGKTIIPLSENEAREWAETSLPADRYEAVFGVAEETSESKIDREQVKLMLACETIALLRRMSKETGVPVARMVDKAVMKQYGD